MNAVTRISTRTPMPVSATTETFAHRYDSAGFSFSGAGCGHGIVSPVLLNSARNSVLPSLAPLIGDTV